MMEEVINKKLNRSNKNVCSFLEIIALNILDHPRIDSVYIINITYLLGILNQKCGSKLLSTVTLKEGR